MPRKLYDATTKQEIEVPTDEELKALQDKAGQVDGLAKKVTDLTNDLSESAPQLRQRLSEQEKKIERLKALEKQGKTIDDTGNIVDMTKGVSVDDARQAGTQAAVEMLINAKKTDIFASIPKDKRDEVEKWYKKLTLGETVTLDNVKDFVVRAYNAAGLRLSSNPILDAHAAGGGSYDGFSGGNEGIGDARYSETDVGMGLADAMGLKYPKSLRKKNNQ